MHKEGTPEHAAWLDQVRERPLEPELPICDPHHHLWDRESHRYLLEELRADLDCGHRIVSTVFVECGADYRAECARCPNVVVKLGGLLMPVNGFGFHKRERPPGSDQVVAATGDWYRHAIDCFGTDRCMFESNFPVDRASISAGVLWNAFQKIAADASPGEKADLFHDTAARVYRLPVSDQGPGHYLGAAGTASLY